MPHLTQFLHQTYPKLHTQLKKSAFLRNEKWNTPNATLPKLMERLTRTLQEWETRNPLQERFWNQFIIKPHEIPENYRALQKKILIERGQGAYLVNGELPEHVKEQLTSILLSEQKTSLERWTHYLSSPDANYSPEIKYRILRSVLQLQAYDKHQGKFPKRNKKTVALFPELNQEALALVINHKIQELRGEEVKKLTSDMTDEDWKAYQQKKSFWDCYALALKLSIKSHGDKLANIKGEWKKYPQGSQANELVQSLEGKGTGRCTAGYNTAKKQLQSGDFYVYYSEDATGAYTKPRLAIRMEGDQIAEIRGIAPWQNLDPYIFPVLDDKLQDFGNEAEKYDQKVAHMRMITAIDQKVKENIPLSKEELYLLYSGVKIQGFWHHWDDPRIKILQTNPDVLLQIWMIEKWEKDLNLDMITMLPEGFQFPEWISYLHLPKLEYLPEGIQFPNNLKRLFIGWLTIRPKNTSLPDLLETLELPYVREIENHASFPKWLKILHLHNLRYFPNNIYLPEKLSKLYLPKLEELESWFIFPKGLKKLYLPNLEILPNQISFPDWLEHLDLASLYELQGTITFPKSLQYLDLRHLSKFPKNLRFPPWTEVNPSYFLQQHFKAKS